MKGLVGLVIGLVCLGVVLGNPPPEPQWPKEMTMVFASEQFQYFVNYSYGTQKLYLDYSTPTGDRSQFYLSCEEDLIYMYTGDSSIGQVCYQDTVKNYDEYLCPLPSNPFHYLVGDNLTYNGQTTFEGQSTYVWMSGYDSFHGECISCTFYWETAVYSTEFRTPIAADFKVTDLNNPPPAGYFQKFYSPLLTNSKAVQPVSPLPDIQCHPYFPPFFPSRSKVEFETTETVPLFRLIQRLRA